MTDDNYHVMYRDLPHGATFVKLRWNDYAEVVEVIDLDSATGAPRMVLVEEGSAGLYGRGFADTRKKWLDVMTSSGPLTDDRFKVTGLDRATLRRIVFEAAWSYGHKDIDSSVVLYDADGTDCEHCGDTLVFHDGVLGHDTELTVGDSNHGYVPCADDEGKELRGTDATIKAPVRFKNGAESWPDLLIEDWQDYADGTAGIERYLSDQYGIEKEQS